MRIAICDSKLSEREKYLAVFRSLAKKHNIDTEFVLFSGGEEVLFRFEDKEFVDVLISEIQMPLLSGFEAAKELRKAGYKGQIIFLTALQDKKNILSGYDVGSLHYIIKDETPLKKIEEIFLRAVEAAKLHDEDYILFMAANEWINIPIRSIRYFETYRRIVTVYYWDQSFEFYASSFENLQKQLAGNGFLRTHRSYLVALKEIKSFTFHSLTTRNGKTLPVGRTYYPGIKQALADYYQTHTVQ